MVDYTQLIENNKTYLSHLHNLLNQDKKQEIKLTTTEKIKIINQAREIQKEILRYTKYNQK
jgi:hypothetical protein